VLLAENLIFETVLAVSFRTEFWGVTTGSIWMDNLVLRIVYHTFECLVSRLVRIVFRKELGLFTFSGERVWRCPMSLVSLKGLFSVAGKV
jgi:hypothetical protein